MYGRITSFRHALRGLASMWRTQPNARIHAGATLLVLAAGAVLGLSREEWALVTVAIALVWIAEALNTAVEFLADAAVPDPHELVKYAKDIAAGGVLLASVAAAAIGLLVFWPHLHELLMQLN